MISEDELILYLYVELDSGRYNEITELLDKDEELRRRLQRLRDDLGRITKVSIDQTSQASAPDTFTSSWHDAISDVADASSEVVDATESQSNWPGNWPVMGLAATLLLALGFGFGYLQRDANAPVYGAKVSEEPVVETMDGLLSANSGIRAHLQDVQYVLSTLDPAQAEVRRRLLKEILMQNELHQKIAQLQGADDLSRLLRAFEQSLLVIAAQESGEVYASREQLEFELGVVLTKLNNNASNRQQSL